MSAFFGSLWWLLVSIGVLITFHEFGHFVVARFFGVHVLRFSIGFGRPLLKRIGRDGTEFVVAAIPLGGYVKMLDEREFEVDPADRHRAFNNKPVLQRMAISVAGPAFNFLLCFALLWAMFVIGQPDYLPVVGRADGLAAQAGFMPGDQLRTIDGEPVATWSDASVLLATGAMDRRALRIKVTRADGGEAMHVLDLDRIPGALATSDAFAKIGLVQQQALAPPVVYSVDPGLPPGLLRADDRILAVDGHAIAGFGQLTETVARVAKPNELLHLTIQRGEQKLQVDVVPRWDASAKPNPRPVIGIQIGPPPYDAVRHYGPIEAMGASVQEMRRETEAIFSLVQRIFSHGEVQDLSGVVGIAKVANFSAQLGFTWFLSFLAILSLNLGLINLLPVPILDGGHLLYYLIELVKGSPVSERMLVVGQYIGLAMLGGLMCLAFYNDLLRPLY